MKSSYCVCGDLARWAIDPEVPVGLRESDSTYVLRLGVNVQVDLLFCPTCGGKAKSAESPECECSTLARWAAFPASCLMSDQKLNEYHLAYSANGRIILYFCPACGRRLSESK